jgi:hypothetical protein
MEFSHQGSNRNTFKENHESRSWIASWWVASDLQKTTKCHFLKNIS